MILSVESPDKTIGKYDIFTLKRTFTRKDGLKFSKVFELWRRRDTGKWSHFPQCYQHLFNPEKDCPCINECKSWLSEHEV